VTSQPGRTVAEMVAHLAARTGTTTAFGHPGGEVVGLIDALERAGIQFILARHEAQAAFMAGGIGELTGRPGICVSTLGPGATNMMTGVASALLERAPLIALTGDLAAAAPPGATHQKLPLSELYAPITKRSLPVTGDTSPETVAHVMSETTVPRPGPVHLSLAADIGQQPAATGAIPDWSGQQATAAPISHAVMATARQMIADARRPAIVVGIGAAEVAVGEALTALAHELGVPVAVLPKAKGIVPEDDPAFLGVLEMAGNDLVAEAIGEADLILTVGVDPVEMDKPWTFTAPVISIDRLADAGGYFTAKVELVGSPASLVDQLRAVGYSGPRWEDSAIAERNSAISNYVRPSGKQLQPWQVVDAVRHVVPKHAIATCDVGAHKLLVGQAWKSFMPRTFFMANGLSSMGYAIPVAVAASIVSPGRQVVAFVGDGGLGMYLGELETLTRVASSVLVVVFADGSLELIRRAQQQRGLAESGTKLSNPDFGHLGKVFGITVTEVDSRAGLDAALDELVPSRGVGMIIAHIDGADYVL
jgi:acetolactate synthase I/II/III large subunit